MEKKSEIKMKNEIFPDSVDNSDESDDNNVLPNGFHDIEERSSDDETDDDDIPLQPRILSAGLDAVSSYNYRVDDSSSEMKIKHNTTSLSVRSWYSGEYLRVQE